MSSQPHDSLVHDTFEHPEHARGELEHMLGAQLSARIDWSTLELVPGSFIDPELANSRSDLLFRVILAEKPAYLYVLFEHQSTPDPLMVFRELQYLVRFLTTWLEDHPDATRLPVVIPMLLYHGPRDWPYPTRFEDLLDLDGETRALVLDFVPRFRLLVDDLTAESDEALRSRAMSELGRLALWLLKTARDTDELLDGVTDWADLLRRVQAAPHGMAALAKLWQYVMAVHEASHERVLPALAAALKNEEQRQTMATIAEQLIEKGEKRGEKRGIEQGEKLGIEKGLRGALLRQLQRRFGPLPAEMSARVEQATVADLDRWLDQVLTAPTLAEVLDQNA